MFDKISEDTDLFTRKQRNRSILCLKRNDVILPSSGLEDVSFDSLYLNEVPPLLTVAPRLKFLKVAVLFDKTNNSHLVLFAILTGILCTVHCGGIG